MLTPQSDCSSTLAEGFLTIDNGMLTGTESECRMTNQVDIRGMDGALFDMICTGEGTAWQERAIVMRGNEDELILVWNGFAFAYPACPVPPTRPRQRPAALGG
ncbi:MAG: hypothetical protein AAFR47_12625 [Pseudomonadota bacterium]